MIENSTEIALHPPEGLAVYRNVDNRWAIGHLPLHTCLELQQATPSDADMSPSQLYDAAWLAMETALAQPSAKDHKRGIAHSRTLFQKASTHPEAAVGLRGRAVIAMGSVGMYSEMQTTGGRVQVLPRALRPMLGAIQKGARMLLEQPQLDASDTAYLDGLVPIFMGTEFCGKDAWWLPAAPRQDWQINAILRPSLLRLALSFVPRAAGSSPGRTQVTILDRSLLGNEAWPADGGHETLKKYIDLRPGMAIATHKHRHNVDEVRMDQLVDPLLAFMSAQTCFKETRPPAGADHIPDPSQSAEQSTDTPAYKPASELLWYIAEPGGDAANLSRESLGKHLEVLCQPERLAALPASEQHLLAWMHIDHAQLLAREAAAHDPADSEYIILMQQSTEAYATAEQLLAESAEGFGEQRIGERYSVLVDKEAVAMFRALSNFNTVGESAFWQAVDSYERRLAALYMSIRDAHKASVRSRNLTQQEYLLEAGLRASFCLIQAVWPDETIKNVLVPCSPRRGGTYGETDGLCFTYDYTRDRFDTQPVSIQLEADTTDTIAQPLHVIVGAQRLVPDGNPLPTFKTLAAHVRSRKSGKRGGGVAQAAIRELASRLSDAIDDACA